MELTQHSIIKFIERVGQPDASFIATEHCAKTFSDWIMLMYTTAFNPFIATVTPIQESSTWPREKEVTDAGICRTKPAAGIILCKSH